MYVGSHKLVEFVEDPVDDLDQEMPLLVFQTRAHQQRQYLVEQWPGAELPRLLGYRLQRALPHRWRPVLHLEEQHHDLPVPHLFACHLVFVRVAEQRTEVAHVLWLDVGQGVLVGCFTGLQVVGLRVDLVGLRDVVALVGLSGGVGRGGVDQLTRWSLLLLGYIAFRGFDDLQ